ncbi:MAG: hypothetical protein ABSA86_06345 [Oryzomonas sp.]
MLTLAVHIDGNGAWKNGGQKQPWSGWLERLAGFWMKTYLKACATSRPQENTVECCCPASPHNNVKNLPVINTTGIPKMQKRFTGKMP